MESKNSKVIALVALVVAVVGLGIGFAAFSSTLTISSSATVTPSQDTFKVLLSNSDTDVVNGAVAGVPTGAATADEATIDAEKLRISGLKANFTKPGQTVTYTFYAHNVGEYIAYLNSVNFASANATCTAGEGATDSLVQAACANITLSVKVGSDAAYTATNASITGHSLDKTAKDTVVVTIAYADTEARADGPFTVAFGDVTLTYGSVD